MEDAVKKADALIEALPYILRFKGRPVVVKFGGSAMEREEVLDDVLEDVVFLATVGIRPVLVHGGGKAISRAMEQKGVEPRFVQGHRVTDEETLRIVVEVLANRVNADIVARIGRHGAPAVAGFDKSKCLLEAEKKTFQGADGEELDLGYVGEIAAVRADEILADLGKDIILAVPPIARDRTGQLYNVNADTAAGAIAAALQAEKIVFLSDVHGIMADPDKPDSLLSSVEEPQVEEMVREGIISGGMLPKVEACITALKAGVRKAHIIDGTLSHSLLLEIFTDKGVGTQIIA